MVGVGGRISSGCYGDDEQGDGDDAAELDQTFGFVCIWLFTDKPYDLK